MRCHVLICNIRVLSNPWLARAILLPDNLPAHYYIGHTLESFIAFGLAFRLSPIHTLTLRPLPPPQSMRNPAHSRPLMSYRSSLSPSSRPIGGLSSHLTSPPKSFCLSQSSRTQIPDIFVDVNAIVCGSTWNESGRREADSHSVLLTIFCPRLEWTFARVFWESILRDNWPASFNASKYSMVGIV